jgi:hypothetical protein
MIKYTELKNSLQYSRDLYTQEKNLMEDTLTFVKNTALFDAIRGNTHLVKEKVNYPKDNKVTIDLDVDLVVMTREEFNKWNKNE